MILSAVTHDEVQTGIICTGIADHTRSKTNSKVIFVLDWQKFSKEKSLVL